MVTHDLGFVSEIVEHVICVNRTLAIHPTSDITGEVIREIYGGDMRMVRHDHRCSEEGHEHHGIS
jgi:zinc transport system ATP-binding protein